MPNAPDIPSEPDTLYGLDTMTPQEAYNAGIDVTCQAFNELSPWVTTTANAERPLDGERCVITWRFAGVMRFELVIYVAAGDVWDRGSRYTGPLFETFTWPDAFMSVPGYRES